MRVVFADIRSRDGFVNKDTVLGGYGSRFRGISATTRIIEILRGLCQNLPSIHVGYLASIFSDAGHSVQVSRGEMFAGDLTLVLTSIVDFRREIEWATEVRRRGATVGFFGTMATHMPEIFVDHGDFVVKGEPENAALRLARGEKLQGLVLSPAVDDLDSLPFPRWDLMSSRHPRYSLGRSLRATRAFPMLTSRSCPEHCTYCPHRITAPYRLRSDANVLAEMKHLCSQWGAVDLVLRDPIFTRNRERVMAIAEGIIRSRLSIRFECETRLDDLDTELLDLLRRAGLRAITFGVESHDPVALRRIGRTPIPSEHQRKIVSYCRDNRIATGAFYILGLLTDTMESVRASIDYAIELNTTTALFKILTPYPGTPLRKQMAPLITEVDLEKFDGYTPTFRHPNLSRDELLFLLKSAYARYYFRPSWLGGYLGLEGALSHALRRWDAYADRRHTEMEMIFHQSRPRLGPLSLNTTDWGG